MVKTSGEPVIFRRPPGYLSSLKLLFWRFIEEFSKIESPNEALVGCYRIE